MLKILPLFIILSHFLFGQEFIEERRIGGEEADVKFNNPRAIAIAQDGLVYVVDTGNNVIHTFNNSGQLQRTYGGFGFRNDQFDRPVDIWLRDLLNIYIADYNNQRVQRYNRTMHFISSLTSDDSSPAEFQFLEVGGCALNSQNDLFVLDGGENKIIKFNRRGQPERSFGGYESGEGQLQEPAQMDIVNNKYLVVTDRNRKALIIFDFFGNFINCISMPDFKSPAGIAVDNERIFIADPIAKKIFIVATDFSKVTAVKLKLTQPVRQPVDLAIAKQKDKNNKFQRLYLIDGGQLIIGRLTH